MNVEVVGIDPHFAWYSGDLIRNDPFLEDRPIVASLINLRPQEVAALTGAGKARLVTREELHALGFSYDLVGTIPGSFPTRLREVGNLRLTRG